MCFLFSLSIFHSPLECGKKEVQWWSKFPFYELLTWCNSCHRVRGQAILLIQLDHCLMDGMVLKLRVWFHFSVWNLWIHCWWMRAHCQWLSSAAVHGLQTPISGSQWFSLIIDIDMCASSHLEEHPWSDKVCPKYGPAKSRWMWAHGWVGHCHGCWNSIDSDDRVTWLTANCKHVVSILRVTNFVFFLSFNYVVGLPHWPSWLCLRSADSDYIYVTTLLTCMAYCVDEVTHWG